MYFLFPLFCEPDNQFPVLELSDFFFFHFFLHRFRSGLPNSYGAYVPLNYIYFSQLLLDILTLNMPICIAPPYDYIKVILIFKKFLSQAMLIKVAVNADNKFDSNNK